MDPTHNPNLARFQASADGWDDTPIRGRRAEAIAAALEERGLLTGQSRVLDVGAGTGLLTLELRARAARVTAVDLSPAMAEALTEKCRRGGIDGVDVVIADLERESPPGADYDLIASSMTWHHIRDVDGLIARCVEVLAPGGWMTLSDLEADASGYHQDDTGVVHQGFDVDDLAARLRNAGLQEVGSEIVLEEVRKEEGVAPQRFRNFLLWGRKP